MSARMIARIARRFFYQWAGLGIFFGFFTLALGGCTAINLFSYNDALVALYDAKNTSDQTEDWIRYENAVAGLDRLAVEAAAEAEKTTGVENKIALYRVAATASWQAGRAKTGELVQPGINLCEIKKNRDAVPRDCGMLLVFPIFAAIDANTKALNAKQAEVLGTDVGAREAFEGEVRPIFREFRNAASLLIDAHTTVSEYAASPGFKQEVSNNMDTVFRLVLQSYQVLRMVTPGPLDKQAACNISSLRTKAENANIDGIILQPLDGIPPDDSLC